MANTTSKSIYIGSNSMSSTTTGTSWSYPKKYKTQSIEFNSLIVKSEIIHARYSEKLHQVLNDLNWQIWKVMYKSENPNKHIMKINSEKKMAIVDIETSMMINFDTLYKVYWKDIGKQTCPLCGEQGEDLIFSFYCSNEDCRNYRK